MGIVLPNETPEKLPTILAAGRQTAAIAQETELSGFLPKAATPVLQRSPNDYYQRRLA
jgi:hypothetical protein